MTYLNVSSGRFINKKAGISEYAYEGKVISIKREMDNYEGKEIPKIVIIMEDEDRVCIKFTEESWYGVGFFSRIEKVDLTQPLMLGISGSEKNDRISFCWMKQGGETIKKDEDFPLPKKVEVGRNTIQDWGEYSERVTVILNELYLTEQTPPENNEEPVPF